MQRRWLTRVVLAVGIAVLLAAMMRALSESRFEAGLAQARDQVRARRFADARPWLAAEAVSRPESVEVAYLLALCEQALGHAEAAATLLARVPAGSTFGPEAAMARGRLLIDLGHYREAEDVLRAALAGQGKKSSASPFRYALAELLYRQGRFDEMRRLAQESWAFSSDPPGDLLDLWKIDNAPPTFEPLFEAVQKAAKQAPDDDRVWLARANLALYRSQLDDALRWLDACLARSPDDPVVWRARLRWAVAAGRSDEALRALGHLTADRFIEPELLVLRAWMASLTGDRATERKTLERLIGQVPGDTRALERLAVLAVDAGELTQAAQLRRLKAEADRTRETYYRTLEGPTPIVHAALLGRLAEALGRGFEARGWWALAERTHPDAESSAAVSRLGSPRPEHLAAPPDHAATLVAWLQPRAGDAARTTASTADSTRKTAESRSSPRPGPLARPVAARFRDDARAAGLRFTLDNGRSRLRQLPETTAGGVGLLDFDGDGWLDVYAVQGGPFPPPGKREDDAGAAPGRPSGDRLFRNRGDGTFEDVTAAAGIDRLARGFGHGVTVGDFDNDGRPDLFLTRWRAYILLRNRGDGTFADVTQAAGLGGDRDWPTSAAFADLDGDGDLDLYVCHYLEWDADHPRLCARQIPPGAPDDPDRHYDYCMPNPIPSRPDQLFRNDGGRFIDVTQAAGIIDSNGRGLGVIAVDVDDDGRIDLFVANDTTANYLWHNLGGMKFEELGVSAGVACNAAGAFQAGMGTAAGDLDGDGLPDLCVTNFYGESTTFFQNLGGGLYADRTSAVGLAGPTRFLLGFGIVLLDANNDGRLDLAQTNGHVLDMRPTAPREMPGLLLLGNAAGQLVDATAEAGADWTAPRIGRAMAAGDLDNDGRVDLVEVPQQSALIDHHNQTAGGHFLTFLLEGTRSNRDAVGASITVTAGGRRRRAWRYGGGSYQSASEPRVHFGLEVDRIDDVEVRWPSGLSQHLGPIAVDRGYRLREGDDRPAPLPGWPAAGASRATPSSRPAR